MAEDEMNPDEIDWQQAGFDGARREQLRCWAALPLEDALDAVEEMGAMSRELAAPPHAEGASLVETARVAEAAQAYGPGDGERDIELAGCTQRS